MKSRTRATKSRDKIARVTSVLSCRGYRARKVRDVGNELTCSDISKILIPSQRSYVRHCLLVVRADSKAPFPPIS